MHRHACCPNTTAAPTPDSPHARPTSTAAPHPSQCGKMDQACAFGSTPVLMTYDGDVLRCEPATLGAPLHYVLVDLAAGKDTVAILAALQVGGR